MANDLWPGATWSSMDGGRWKALQYFSKRFFAPVLPTLLEDPDDSTVQIHLSNHRPRACRAQVFWEITTADGRSLESGQLEACVPSQANVLLETLDLSRYRNGSPALPSGILSVLPAPRAADRDLPVWVRVGQSGREVARNVGFFAKPKYLRLKAPTIEIRIVSLDGSRAELESSTDVPSLWTRIELDGIEVRFSDNCLHLQPRHPSRVEVDLPAPPTAGVFEKALRVTPPTA